MRENESVMEIRFFVGEHDIAEIVKWYKFSSMVPVPRVGDEVMILEEFYKVESVHWDYTAPISVEVMVN